MKRREFLGLTGLAVLSPLNLIANSDKNDLSGFKISAFYNDKFQFSFSNVKVKLIDNLILWEAEFICKVEKLEINSLVLLSPENIVIGFHSNYFSMKSEDKVFVNYKICTETINSFDTKTWVPIAEKYTLEKYKVNAYFNNIIKMKIDHASKNLS